MKIDWWWHYYDAIAKKEEKENQLGVNGIALIHKVINPACNLIERTIDQIQTVNHWKISDKKYDTTIKILKKTKRRQI